MMMLTPLIITLPLKLKVQKRSIKHSNKHLLDYLHNERISTLFLEPTDQEQIVNIISSLNSNKASGPNGIPNRILLLLKNEISKQLAHYSTSPS